MGGMGNLFGSSKGPTSNASTTDNSNRTSNVQGSADNGASITTLGEGASLRTGIDAGGSVSVTNNSIDPGAFEFASSVASQALASNTATVRGIESLSESTTGTLAKLAQGTALGTDWKQYALPALGLVAVLLVLFIGRRK